MTAACRSSLRTALLLAVIAAAWWLALPPAPVGAQEAPTLCPGCYVYSDQWYAYDPDRAERRAGGDSLPLLILAAPEPDVAADGAGPGGGPGGAAGPACAPLPATGASRRPQLSSWW